MPYHAVSSVKIWFAVLVAILLCQPFGFTPAIRAQAPTSRQLLDQANEALMRSEVDRYATLLQSAWQAEGPPKDRVDAGTELGNYQWRIQNNPEKAKEIFAAAIALKTKTTAPLLGRARMERFLGDFAGARADARAALAAATEPSEVRNSKISFASSVVEEILQSELDHGGSAKSTDRDTVVREAFTTIDSVISEEPGLSGASRLQMLLALLVGDGPAARRGWHSYYRVPDGADAPAPLTESGRILDRILPTFGETADAQTRQKIVVALGNARLFHEAAVLALHWKVPRTPEIQELILYLRWIRNLSRSTNEEYRQHALGKADNARLQKSIESQGETLWNGLKWPSKPAGYNMTRLIAELGNRFGAIIRMYPGNINFGHIVLEETQRIDQYGRSTVMRYIELDSIVSNAYSTWLWDGRASVGGWAYPVTESKPATIVRTRNDGAIGVWNSVSDPAVIARNREAQERFNAEDQTRAKVNPYGYFPGLSARMANRGRQNLLNRLKEKGLTGAELRTTFISEYERLTLASIIFAHEGRHALDETQKSEKLTGVDLEFRAKLSEIAFAPEPLLATGGIFAGNIGVQGDNHGMANERIMHGLVQWMESHKSEIAGLDVSQALLPQFDRLTDDQMRAAFRSMDPWAKFK